MINTKTTPNRHQSWSNMNMETIRVKLTEKKKT